MSLHLSEFAVRPMVGGGYVGYEATARFDGIDQTVAARCPVGRKATLDMQREALRIMLDDVFRLAAQAQEDTP